MKTLIALYLATSPLAVTTTPNIMEPTPIEMNILSPENLDAISKSISNGDAAALAAYFDSSVEISIADEADMYDKAQGIQIVKGFFGKNKPKTYSQVHKGASKGKDTQYCIGNLQTTSGTAYRVYIYIKVIGAQMLIQELRFDKA